VTSVTKGSTVQVTLHQVNADGAGPYVCDLDATSNAGVAFTNLTVTNNVPGANGLSQAKEQDFNMTIQMPSDLACTGGSTGNICTVRCRNNAVAGPFGGCCQLFLVLVVFYLLIICSCCSANRRYSKCQLSLHNFNRSDPLRCYGPNPTKQQGLASSCGSKPSSWWN
jgi:hypothetical protein